MLALVYPIYVWTATRVPWTWYLVIGTAVTFLVGYAASAAEGESNP
ncbi:MAG: hypothetical protein WA188_12710 [Terriglobales bacterium]